MNWAMSALKEFLGHCDRTIKYRIACKTLKTNHPLTKEKIDEKMAGKRSYREKFMEYLKLIPVKLVARREVQI